MYYYIVEILVLVHFSETIRQTRCSTPRFLHSTVRRHRFSELTTPGATVPPTFTVQLCCRVNLGKIDRKRKTWNSEICPSRSFQNRRGVTTRPGSTCIVRTTTKQMKDFRLDGRTGKRKCWSDTPATPISTWTPGS